MVTTVQRFHCYSSSNLNSLPADTDQGRTDYHKQKQNSIHCIKVSNLHCHRELEQQGQLGGVYSEQFYLKAVHIVLYD